MPSNRFVRLVTKDGTTMTGRLLNHDTFTVQIIDLKEQLVSQPMSNLRELTFIDKSPMPSYRDKLSRAGAGGPGQLPRLAERRSAMTHA